VPNESGKLTRADVPIINDFFSRVSSDNCLTCPITGARVPISNWEISERLCMLPTSGTHLKGDLTTTAPVLSCRSPAGGVVFIDAIHMGLLRSAMAS
jgi:hypothetical protein